jgi:hypothetical protein
MDKPDRRIDDPVFSEALLDIASRVVWDQQENRRDPNRIQMMAALGSPGLCRLTAR